MKTVLIRKDLLTELEHNTLFNPTCVKIKELVVKMWVELVIDMHSIQQPIRNQLMEEGR